MLFVCTSFDADARSKRKEEPKPPAEATDASKPAEKAAPDDKTAAPAATSPAPAAAPGPAAGHAGPAPAPAAAPKELANDVSGPKQEAARSHFVRGVELYTYGDFPNAWLEFNSAYQIVPLVDLLNNMARCEVRMGRLREALEHFQSFIAARPNDQDSEYIRQEIARIEGELGRGKIAAATPEPTVTAPPPKPRRIPIVGIMFGVTTLALVIAGAATLGVVNSTYNDLQGRPCGQFHACSPDDVGVLERQSYAGYGLLGAAGLTAAVTGLSLYLELRNNQEASLRPLAGLERSTMPGLAIGGRF